MNENEIGTIILDCAFKVHSALGPGLLESTYEACLVYELKKAGLKAEPQKVLPVVYDDIKLDTGYRIDILVNDKVIIENKSVKVLEDIHMAQIITYLKLSDSKLGYLINWNVTRLKNGIRRVVNNL